MIRAQDAAMPTLWEVTEAGNKVYQQWTRLWNGELSLADEIIADGFYPHITNRRHVQVEAETQRNAAALKGWVETVRSAFESITYSIKEGPFVDPYKKMVITHWEAEGTYAGKTGAPGDVAGAPMKMIGIDILSFRNGKIYECWTLNNTVG